MKEKKKRPGKNSHKAPSSSSPATSLNSSTSNNSNKQRRSQHHTNSSGDASNNNDGPRKLGRPRKPNSEGGSGGGGGGGSDSQNEGSAGSSQGGRRGSASGSETEGSSDSENEFSFDSEEEEDDSEEEEDGEIVDEDDDHDDAGGKDGIQGQQKRHDRDKGGRGPGGDSSGPSSSSHLDLRATSSTDPASADDEKSHSDSEEERRRQKKLFKKHLQQAAHKIQAQWKKKVGLVTREDREKDGKSPTNDASRGVSPIRKKETSTNSNSSTSSNAGSEKKKNKASKSQTVPPPDVKVLEWNRGLPEKKCKKHITSGLRVKVCFAAKVKRDGKVVKKRIWYGGRVLAVSKDGSKIRIEYDDGTSEISKFPDKDVVVDDDGNGEHRVSAHKFIPPSLRKESTVDHETDDVDQVDEDDVPEPDTESIPEAVPKGIVTEPPKEPESGEITDAPTTVENVVNTTTDTETEKVEATPEAVDSTPKETGDAEREETKDVETVAEVVSMETEEPEFVPTTPTSTTKVSRAITDDSRNHELLRDPGSPEEGELSPGLSLVTREKTIDIEVKIPGISNGDDAGSSFEENPALRIPDMTTEPSIVPESVGKDPVESKEDRASNPGAGSSPSTPKLTIRISNVTAPKIPKPTESESEEELRSDTPVTERKVKSIQLKSKRKRDSDRSTDDPPSKRKVDPRQYDVPSVAPCVPETEVASVAKEITTTEPIEEPSSLLVDTPQHEAQEDIETPEEASSPPIDDSIELPQLPVYEKKKKDESKSPSSTGDVTTIPSRSSSPPHDAAEVAPPLEEKDVVDPSPLEPETSHKDATSKTCVPDESESNGVAQTKDVGDSMAGDRRGLKIAQQDKEKTTPKQEEKLEKPKKKRKRKEEEEEEVKPSDASVDDRQWVQCDSCGKWRILPSEVKVSSLPKHWYCHLNTYDPKRNHCGAPEQTAKQANKEWRKARKRAKQQRLEEPKEAADVPIEAPQEVEKDEPMITISPKSGKGKKIKRVSPIFSEDSIPGPDAPKLEKKQKNKGKVPLEICEPVPVALLEAEAMKKPGRKRGRPARNQTPQKENDDNDNVEWVQCEKCEKWRKLPPHVSADELPDTWYCKMNYWNPDSASCDAPEDKADASHHEVGTFAGMFGTGASKNSYRALIFGTGKKHNRPMSEKARAAESLFMRPLDDTENPCPTVMYSTSSCFMTRTSNVNKASTIEEEKPPGIFDVLSNSDLFAELRGICRPCHVTSNGAGPKAPMFANTPDEIKHILSEIVLRALGEGVLTEDELILAIHGFPWESLSLDFAVVRPYFNADIIINILLALVRDGVVEMTSFRDLRVPMGQWIPRYRKVRSLRARRIEESIKASRCMKISKPWKQRDLEKSSGSEWVTGVSAFP